MELRQFVSVLFKRLWLILFATLLTGGMTFYLSTTMTPVYQATTTVEIDPGADPRSDLYSALRTAEMVAGTYVEQIQSPTIMRAAIERLGLALTPKELGEGLSVQQVRDTQLVQISVENTNPVLAQALADTLAQVFIDRELGKQQSRFQAGLADLDQQVAALESSIGETQKAMASIGDPEGTENSAMPVLARLELARLESQLTTGQTRLTILLRSVEDFRLAQARYTDFLSVFSPAGLPTEPVRPRTALNTVLGVISGLVLGVSTAFLMEYLDDTIRSPADVKQALPVGVLGVVPRLKDNGGQPRLIVAREPRKPAAEAFRNLRTSIQFSSVDRPARTLLVTSPLPSDGKTFTAANLAVVMAQSGQSVVLVDADMRRPLQHTIFGMSKGIGISAALLDPENANAALQPTDIDGLMLITAGENVPNPAELLASQRMRGFLSWLSDRADVVVIDSPPVLAFADAAVLSNLSDGTLLVLDCNSTRRSAALQAVERLQGVGGTVLGVVLNRMSPGVDGYYYYDYYYRYYSKDGHRKGRGKKKKNSRNRRKNR